MQKSKTGLDIADPIHKATIIPRGRALGMVQHLPIDDKVSMTLAEVRANLSIALAGRCAEEIFFGPDKITTGAESDIAMATRLARYSITTAGLSKKVGLAAINQVGTFGTRGALENASEKTAEIVDAEIQNWLTAAHADATKHLTKNKKTVEKLANELVISSSGSSSSRSSLPSSISQAPCFRARRSIPSITFAAAAHSRIFGLISSPWARSLPPRR